MVEKVKPKLKTKKPRSKSKPRQSQKQTQIVNVKIVSPAEKPKRRRRAKSKPKIPPSFSSQRAGGGSETGLARVIYPITPIPADKPKSDFDEYDKALLRALAARQTTDNLRQPEQPEGAPEPPLLTRGNQPQNNLIPPPQPLLRGDSTASSITGTEYSLRGDEEKEDDEDETTPLGSTQQGKPEPLDKYDADDVRFLQEIARQQEEQEKEKVAAEQSKQTLDQSIKSMSASAAEEPPPSPQTIKLKKGRPAKTEEQKQAEKQEKERVKQQREDERAAQLAGKIRGGSGGGFIRMGF